MNAKKHHRLTLITAVAAITTLALVLVAPSSDATADPKKPSPSKDDVIVQEFTGTGGTGTAWRVTWGVEYPWGFVITDADFRRGQGEPWTQVLGDARLSQILVPYHAGSPRLQDINPYATLDPVYPLHAGCCGRPGPKIQTPYYGEQSVFIQELRDTGVSHIKQKDTGKPPDFLEFRRGQALVLWAIYDTGNYDYIIEYSFHDDGMISFRLGAGGFNAFPWEPHMHSAYWRINVDLGGPAHDTVLLAEHAEPGTLAATDSALPFNGGVEGFEDWEAESFTTLRVQDELETNAYGRRISYDLMPLNRGVSRHFGPGEGYTQHDFWATVEDPGQLDVRAVPVYAADAASVVDGDVVLWAAASAHHHPRSEDLAYPDTPHVNPLTGAQGATRVMWSGFDLRPRDFFDATPLIGELGP